MQYRQHGEEARQGNVVIITGASSGIGEATARLLAQEGFRVFGTSRRKCESQDGVEMLQLDVRSDASVAELVGQILERAGRVDLLVNNAGTWRLGFVEETTMDDARAVFETNFYGAVRMINAVLPTMRSRRQGRIINVGSLAAWVGEPGEGFYSASKRALAGFTESLRHEVWPFGIHVCLVEPDVFKTGIFDTTAATQSTIADYSRSRQAVRRTFQKALEKGGDPREVARTILKVAQARSPRLRYGVGGAAHWLPYFKTLMPQSLFDYVLHRAFGLLRNAD
jgi:NAD(P)-dependent dehydrogenase (short-subunit alcohol dehydrogenase family)